MKDSFDPHPGPLRRGDLIVVEVNGALVPKLSGKGPQWFVVLTDDVGAGVKLKSFHDETTAHHARKYTAAGFNF